jgi:hypothetical protein
VKSPKESVPDNSVKVDLPSFKSFVNGQQVSNTTSKYPIVQYKNITYCPMTWNYTQALRLEVNWDATAGFSIKKLREVPPSSFSTRESLRQKEYPVLVLKRRMLFIFQSNIVAKKLAYW